MTLLEYFETHFAPRLRDSSQKQYRAAVRRFAAFLGRSAQLDDELGSCLSAFCDSDRFKESTREEWRRRLNAIIRAAIRDGHLPAGADIKSGWQLEREATAADDDDGCHRSPDANAAACPVCGIKRPGNRWHRRNAEGDGWQLRLPGRVAGSFSFRDVSAAVATAAYAHEVHDEWERGTPKTPEEYPLRMFYVRQYERLKLLGRSPNTKRLYAFTLRSFARFLEREPMLSDLTDETVAEYVQWTLDAGRSPHTAEKERCQLLALWRYAARKRLVEQFPDLNPVPRPTRLPKAWTPEQVRALFEAAVATDDINARHRQPLKDADRVPWGCWWRSSMRPGSASGRRCRCGGAITTRPHASFTSAAKPRSSRRTRSLR